MGNITSWWSLCKEASLWDWKSASGNTIRKKKTGHILGVNISTISHSLKKISEMQKFDKCLPHENSVCCCIWEIRMIYFLIHTKVIYSFQILIFTPKRLRGPAYLPDIGVAHFKSVVSNQSITVQLDEKYIQLSKIRPAYSIVDLKFCFLTMSYLASRCKPTCDTKVCCIHHISLILKPIFFKHLIII